MSGKYLGTIGLGLSDELETIANGIGYTTDLDKYGSSRYLDADAFWDDALFKMDEGNTNAVEVRLDGLDYVMVVASPARWWTVVCADGCDDHYEDVCDWLDEYGGGARVFDEGTRKEMWRDLGSPSDSWWYKTVVAN